MYSRRGDNSRRLFSRGRYVALLLIPFVLRCQTTSPGEQCAAYTEIAKKSYHELQTNYSESSYALALRGEARYQTHRNNEALALYRAAASRQPDLRGVHSALASVYLALNDSERAEGEARAERALGIPDCAVERVACAFAATRFVDVIDEVTSVGGPEALYWRARASRELADRFCNQVNATPESLESHEGKAEALERVSRFREAAVEWRSALNLAPRDSRVRNRLATALFQSQDFQAVLPELKRLLEAEPNSANLNFFTGDALLETERPEQAVAYLTRALKTNLHLLPAHVALGLAYVRIGQPAKAIPHLKAGLPLDRNGGLYYQLARAYRSANQPRQARRMTELYRQRAGSAANLPAQ